jgi:DNA repair photolyase
MTVSSRGPATARQPDACLVFPPLVVGSIGSYYPSLAVLASYLLHSGRSAWQVDLNEDFAAYLLADGRLSRCAAGDFGDGATHAVDSPERIAARWLDARDPDALVAPDGRHLFGAAGRNREAMMVFADAYSIDPDAGVLAASPNADPRAQVYEDFFAGHPLLDRLPASVRLLGISVPMGPQLLPTLLYARMATERRPDLRVVVGGATMSLLNDDDLAALLLANPAIDAVVRYDGELPLAALVEQAAAGEWTPERVPGVSAVCGREVRHMPPGIGLHPNQLPHSLYDAGLLERLVEPDLSITQARGCYWGKCAYCDFIELYEGSPRYRGRRPESFVAELEHQVATHGTRSFVFITEALPPAFARKASELILARGLDISWRSFVMVERHFDATLFRLMAKAGCSSLSIGMETMNDRVLKLVRKHATSEMNVRFLRTAREAGISLHVNLIPDLPSTTYVEAVEALDRVREHADCIEQIAVFPFEPTRSSDVGRTPAAFGLQPSAAAGQTGIAEYALNHLQSDDPAMTPAERARVHGMYFDFADSVNGRVPASDALRNGARLRVAADDLDVVGFNDGYLYSSVRTWRAVRVSSDVHSCLEPHLSGRPFALDELRERLGLGILALPRLQAAGMLVETS